TPLPGLPGLPAAVLFRPDGAVCRTAGGRALPVERVLRAGTGDSANGGTEGLLSSAHHLLCRSAAGADAADRPGRHRLLGDGALWLAPAPPAAGRPPGAAATGCGPAAPRPQRPGVNVELSRTISVEI